MFNNLKKNKKIKFENLNPDSSIASMPPLKVK